MRRWAVIGLVGGLLAGIAPASAATAQADGLGPLRVLRSNPRYFTDRSGRAVYLTGSHVWWNLAADKTWPQCFGTAPEAFDYSEHLDRLRGYGHNFVRLWRIEVLRWTECGVQSGVPLQPWKRTGPGLATDGLPKFDLDRLEPAYFTRLRARVAEARRKGFYVSIMLFEGWHIQFLLQQAGWRNNPFNPQNNVNGIDGDLNGDGSGIEIHTLASRRITTIQDAYVRKVIDSVNGFDNVLYEVANESGVFSTAWQYHVIDLVKSYERSKPKRHPIGMTYQHGGDFEGRRLFASKADWVSPYGRGPTDLTDPLVAAGRKVVLLDTDHLCGVCGGGDFIWRAFARGYNPIFMDPMDADTLRESARLAMGQTRRYALRLDLARMRPRDDLGSTDFSLASLGSQYLVYLPKGGAFWVPLGRRATYRGEWFRPSDGRLTRFTLRRAGGRFSFRPPFPGPAVLVLQRSRR
jgi:hypothetical protein